MGKILLVGGAGYVGCVLAEELLARGYAIRMLDRLYYGDYGLQRIRDRIELIVADMRTVGPEIFEGIDAVINTGGLSNDPLANWNPEANREMNTTATLTLARLAIEAGIQRYIFASTCSIYDQGVGPETEDFVQDEETEVNPKAAYSSSKYAAELGLLEMSKEDEHFCPIILRKGTIYGFSPRMRYDLVVNTLTKCALSQGYMNLHHGGEMWRPLVDIHDVARAYIACLRADTEKVKGQIFNISYRNYRISEIGLRVREALRGLGKEAEIRVDYGYRGVRSYRVNSSKIEQALGFAPEISVEESVVDMVQKIHRYGYDDFENPRYYNIRWVELLEEAGQVISIGESLF